MTWKSSWSQNLVPCFFLLFSISKGRAVVNSPFPAGRGKGHFSCVWENGTPPPPEDGSSQEHLFAPIEASPTRILGIGGSRCGRPAALQYSFPTCPAAATAGERSGQGTLFLGPVMAQPAAANVHPEPGPGSAARVKKKKRKKKSLFSSCPQSTRLSTGS